MENVEISVIVPVYNTSKYLESCVASILEQTFHAFELILIDDASTDGSECLCDNLANTDRRIKVIHNPINIGVAATRNKGIRQARGNFIQFVDSDDWIEPQMLQKMHSALQESNTDFVMCAIEKVDESLRERQTVLGGKTGYHPIAELQELITQEHFADLYIGSPVNKLYRHDLALLCEFPDGMSWMEDYYFNLQYFMQATSFYVCDDALYKYLIHSTESLSDARVPLQKDCEDMKKVAWKVSDFLEKDNTPTIKTISDIWLFFMAWALLRHTPEEIRKEREYILALLRERKMKEAAENFSGRNWKRFALSLAVKWDCIIPILITGWAKSFARVLQRSH